jgi:hypothetical protein
MKKVFLALLALAAALAISPVAAAQSYDFSFASTSYSGDGILTVTGGVITGLTGTFYLDGVNVGAMALLDPNAFASNDNVFAPPPQFVSENGLSFVAGGLDYNLYNFATTEGGYAPTGCSIGGDCITANANGIPSETLNFLNVPEYGGLAMLILSALTLAGGFFFKGRQSGLFLAA